MKSRDASASKNVDITPAENIFKISRKKDGKEKTNCPIVGHSKLMVHAYVKGPSQRQVLDTDIIAQSYNSKSPKRYKCDAFLFHADIPL